MPITRGVLAQSPEPEAHDKVLDNNPDRIEIGKCWFLRREENRSTAPSLRPLSYFPLTVIYLIINTPL